MSTDSSTLRKPYVETSGDGPSVILLHSSGMSGRQWRRLATELAARGLRTIVPDLAGHGQSPTWPDGTPLSFQIDVDETLALLETIDDEVDLIGHSYGGLVALLVAAFRPKRVRSLVLYDPVAFGTLGPEDADARRDLAQVPSHWEDSPEGRERWLEAFVDFWGGRGAWPSLRAEARDEFRRVAWALYQGVASLVRDPTPASAYRLIDAPVLLMTGEKTPLAERRVVQRLSESFPHAKVHVVAGAGHMGPLTHAAAVNATIAEWLAKRPVQS
jgi:pimeloyl-ACP methyl ester carboxylesterase